MTLLEQLETKVLLERLVIGLEEPILVKGLGELQAKIDSGNGGYNVIHGTDFHQQGNELMFTTHDSFGHEKKIQAKVIDTIEVNMGGGNIENRPVIELDIKFAGEDYKKIPFSVSDRSTNTNPILISKGFVEKELEALIDVGAKNISNDGIDVVYGESFWDKTKTVGKAVGKAGASVAKGGWEAAKRAKNGLDNAATWLKGGDNVSLLEPVKGAVNMAKDITKGVGGAIAALGGAAVLKKITQFAKNIGNHDKFLEDDQTKVKQALSYCVLPKKLVNEEQVDKNRTVLEQMASGTYKDWKVLPVCNYLCEKGQSKDDIKGLEERRKQFKKLIAKAKEAVSELKKNKDTHQEEQMGESFVLLEALILLEQDDVNSGEVKSSSQDQENYEEITTALEQLRNFTLWFIPFGKQYDSDKIAYYSQQYMDDFFKNADNTLIGMFNSGSVDVDSTKQTIQKLAYQLNEKTKKLETSNEYQGFFALVTGEDREVSFYESLDCTSYARKSQSKEQTTEDEEDSWIHTKLIKLRQKGLF